MEKTNSEGARKSHLHLEVCTYHMYILLSKSYYVRKKHCNKSFIHAHLCVLKLQTHSTCSLSLEDIGSLVTDALTVALTVARY